GEESEDDDPWAVVAANRKREQEEKEKRITGGGAGLVGLHDVVLAPPKFSKVPKAKFEVKDMADVIKKGGLKKQTELGEARKSVIEGYRAMMREKSKIP
ncbi:MAG: hypothetical protein Q9218_006997, partial [Villophora microphyllina]